MAKKVQPPFDIKAYLKEWDGKTLPYSQLLMEVATKLVHNPDAVPSNLWTGDIIAQAREAGLLTLTPELDATLNLNTVQP